MTARKPGAIASLLACLCLCFAQAQAQVVRPGAPPMAHRAAVQFTTPSLPALSTPAAVVEADYDASSQAAANMTLVQGSTRAGYSPATYFDYNRISVLNNLAAANAGALPALSYIQPGAFVTNGPLEEPAYLGDNISGALFQDDEKGIGTASGSGIARSSTASFSGLIVLTLQKGTRRVVKSTTNNFGVAIELGSKFGIGHTGAGGSTPGQICVTTNSSSCTALETGSRALQTVDVIWAENNTGAAIEGQASGTIRFWVGGVQTGSDIAYVNDTTSPQQIMLGNLVTPTSANNLLDGAFHEAVIISGRISGSDVQALHGYAQAKYPLIGRTGMGYYARVLGGQSVAQEMTGTSPSGTGANAQSLDWTATVSDTGLREFFGTPHIRDDSTFGTTNTYLAARALLESNSTAASQTAYAASGQGFIRNVGSGYTADPSTWTQDADGTASSDGGQTIYPFLQAYPLASSLPWVWWVQGENDALSFTPHASGGYWNWQVTGSPYAAYTIDQIAALMGSAFTKHVGLLRSASGSANLKLAVRMIAGNIYGGGDLWRMAAMQWVAANPSLGIMFDANPWQTYESDPSSLIHETPRSALSTQLVRTREEGCAMEQAGLAPAGSSRPGPSYCAFPIISSIVAKAGNSYIDVLVSDANPGVTTLKLPAAQSDALRGWELWISGRTYGGSAYAGTTTTSTTVNGFTLTYEKTGYEFQTATSVTGETLSSIALAGPMDIRISFSTPLVSGQKVTECFGREGASVLNRYITASTYASPGYGTQITDNASTTAPTEIGVDARFRTDMALTIDPACHAVTVQ